MTMDTNLGRPPYYYRNISLEYLLLKRLLGAAKQSSYLCLVLSNEHQFYLYFPTYTESSRLHYIRGKTQLYPYDIAFR